MNIKIKNLNQSIGIQPNTFPVTEKNTEIEYLKSIAKNSCVNVYPIGALTKNSDGNDEFV